MIAESAVRTTVEPEARRVFDRQKEHAERMLILTRARQEELEWARLAENEVIEAAQPERYNGQLVTPKDKSGAEKPSDPVAKLSRDRVIPKPKIRQEVITGLATTADASPSDSVEVPALPIEAQPTVVRAGEAARVDTPAPDIPVDVQIHISEKEFGPPLTAQTVGEATIHSGDGQVAEIVSNEALLGEEEVAEVIDLAEASAWHHEEVAVDDEALATFDDLMRLLDAQETIASIDTPEIYETFIQDAAATPRLEVAETIVPNLFAEFVATSAQPEAVPDIETILVSANEQPLEETLVQLSFCLAETSHDSQRPDMPDIEVALRDVLEAIELGNTNSTTSKAELVTPELTQKLLVLLRAVGYENPKEVLVDFVAREGLEFLLQAIEYLYQLLDDNNRREFSSRIPVTPSSVKADDPLSSRIGRAIVSYFISYKFAADL